MELQEPVVCCELGFLYTKEALLRALVSGSLPEKAAHVKSMKDVTDVTLAKRDGDGDTLNAGAGGGGGDGGGGGVAYRGARFQCPVTFRDMNGVNKFAVIRTSGVAVSMEAVRQVAAESKTCPVTGKHFDPEADLIILYPDEEEMVGARARMKQRKKAAKAAKKAAKKEKKAAAAEGKASSAADRELKMRFLGKDGEGAAAKGGAAGAGKQESGGVEKRKAAQFSMGKIQQEVRHNACFPCWHVFAGTPLCKL